MEGIPDPGNGYGLKRYLTIGIVSAGVAAIAAGLWKAHEDRFDAVAHLPARDATIAYMDVNALRAAGILKLLAAKPESEEADYLVFVRSTGFDYQKDLDSVAASFAPEGTYFIVTGRFDWAKLEAYANANGGACYERLCHLAGSVPSRHISFLPLAPNIMALAVAKDDFAAARLRETRAHAASASSDPVWVSVPAGALKRSAGLPPALRTFAAALEGADNILLTAGPGKRGDFAARIEAECDSPATAQTLSSRLSQSFQSKAIFRPSGKKVLGEWPIPRTFFDNLAGDL